jgi:hypothetical protein
MMNDTQSIVRLFQNFSFWNSFLKFGGKNGQARFFREFVPKLTGLLNKSNIGRTARP